MLYLLRADKALMVMVLNRDEELKIMAICTGTCWERGVEKSLLLASSWMKFSSTSAVSYKLETPCSKGVPHLYHGQILSSDQQELILSSQLPHTAPLGRDRQRRGRDFVKWH